MCNDGSGILRPRRWGIKPRKYNLLFHILAPLVFADSHLPIRAYPLEKRSLFPRDDLSTPKHNFGQKQVTRSLLWLVQSGRVMKERWEEEVFHQRRGWRSYKTNTITITDYCTWPLHFLTHSRHLLPNIKFKNSHLWKCQYPAYKRKHSHPFRRDNPNHIIC